MQCWLIETTYSPHTLTHPLIPPYIHTITHTLPITHLLTLTLTLIPSTHIHSLLHTDAHQMHAQISGSASASKGLYVIHRSLPDNDSIWEDRGNHTQLGLYQLAHSLYWFDPLFKMVNGKPHQRTQSSYIS